MRDPQVVLLERIASRATARRSDELIDTMQRADYTDPVGDELAFDARQRAKAQN
jgi:hypothetical protein